MMDAMTRIERALNASLARADGPGAPPRLAAAMQHSVFPKGARIRPRLCLAVAAACGETDPSIADAAAAAIEFLHCASLVHDDLPCFDDAETRRGRPSVHRAYGEPLAVLAGDALIILAFQTLAWGAAQQPQRLAALTLTVARAVGMPGGICAGQAWECEPSVEVAAYHRAKTGSLFAAATEAGAAAVGVPCERWRTLGAKLGEAYQVADDIRDVVCNPDELGKPIGQDVALGRPSTVAELGLSGAVGRLADLAAEAVASIPACPGERELRGLILQESKRLLPKQLAQAAA
jgi:geranylgeranyl diphosphate synthase type II